MNTMKLILASASPRRKEILSTIGLTFEVKVSDVDESIQPSEQPYDYVKRLAYEKAMNIANVSEAALIIGGDTIVVIDDRILLKPTGIEDARAMLKTLSGRAHQVMTGIAVINNQTGDYYNNVAITDVTMKIYSDDWIEQYISTGEPMDKAGAYGIQGIGAILVDKVEGDYNTVVGLPVSEIIKAFESLNMDYFKLI